MELNLSLLSDDNRIRFSELGVFPEDVAVPIGMAACLWAYTAGLDRHDSEALLVTCDDASLLLDVEFGGGTFRFHDSVREFLQDQAGDARRNTQHKRLIRAIIDNAVAQDTADYIYRYLPGHLAAAQDRDTLDRLLLDPGWLEAKLAVTSSPQGLVADYEQYGSGQLHA